MTQFPQNSPTPVPDRDTEPFWAGCRERRLLVRRCGSCGRSHYPPVGHCPWCISEDLSWSQASGEGHVRSFVVFRHTFIPGLENELPYTILKVVLDDHPDATLYGRLRGPRQSEVEIDSPVELDWEQIGEGFVLPNWRLTTFPADGSTT